MYKITVYPANKEFFAEKDSNLMDILLYNNIEIANHCAGNGSCKKCLIRLINGQINDSAKYQNNYLACQSKLLSNITIEILNDQRINKHDEGLLISNNNDFQPFIEKKELILSTEKINDKLFDIEKIQNYIPEYKISNIDILRKLPHFARQNNWNFSLILNNLNKEILDITRVSENIYGIAVDIGTTTVNLILVNLLNGDIVDTQSSYNKQICYGSDVISRIVFSQKQDGLTKLHELIVNNINELINNLLTANNIDKSAIYSIIASGNTTMIHLLAKIPPDFIRIEPYTPVFSNLQMKAGDIHLAINHNAKVYCPPSMGSYVGGDIMSGILASKMHKSDKIKLLIDIGTNGEIVLGNEEWLMSCACSAGPAFEGAGIKCGTRAISGAIESFSINKDSLRDSYKTINNSEASGICGSGIIDIIAELLDKKLIDRQGHFFKDKHSKIQTYNNSTSYFISPKIFITQEDIENIIRTKGAIFSGIMSLLNYAGIELADIDEILIAGGIGQHINFKNAIKIGLLPDISLQKYKYIGNSSLNGAYQLLTNKNSFAEIEQILSIMNYFDISDDNKYMDCFVGSLFLPHTDLSLFPSLNKK